MLEREQQLLEWLILSGRNLRGHKQSIRRLRYPRYRRNPRGSR
ncbi:hypothetical protein Thiowin_02760 [Thiorhodovibrio winogradskyi]|uniref:Uncharacterized protein n=1 Tax=Thiorhodovibrio winogradskyi TaxID=77007 RepID=A0ABZ0S9L2_9GAMM